MAKVKIEKQKQRKKLDELPKMFRSSYEVNRKLMTDVKAKIKAENKKNGTTIKLIDVIRSSFETYVEG